MKRGTRCILVLSATVLAAQYAGSQPVSGMVYFTDGKTRQFRDVVEFCYTKNGVPVKYNDQTRIIPFANMRSYVIESQEPLKNFWGTPVLNCTVVVTTTTGAQTRFQETIAMFCVKVVIQDELTGEANTQWIGFDEIVNGVRTLLVNKVQFDN